MEASSVLASIVAALASLVVLASVVAWSVGAWLARVSADLGRQPVAAARHNRDRRFAPA
ncbi:MAG: hypothetical protein IT374_07520 [Polyangiaceae bacterium]|nr:hypothetical protein [Polyangiaceae bacterium]